MSSLLLSFPLQSFVFPFPSNIRLWPPGHSLKISPGSQSLSATPLLPLVLGFLLFQWCCPICTSGTKSPYSQFQISYFLLTTPMFLAHTSNPPTRITPGIHQDPQSISLLTAPHLPYSLAFLLTQHGLHSLSYTLTPLSLTLFKAQQEKSNSVKSSSPPTEHLLSSK